MIEIKFIQIVASILALAIAIIGHEIMHGYIAYKYGDTTAKNAGRLSINPIVHIDLVGTIIIPAVLYFTNAPFLFGWAKPVPVNMQRVIFNAGYKGAIAVALAGVTYNLLLAIFCSTLLPAFIPPQNLISAFLAIFLAQSVMINIVLAVFNLWPIPPLDGSQVILYLAMKMRWYKLASFYEQIYPYGMIIIFAILFIPGLSHILFLPAIWLENILLP